MVQWLVKGQHSNIGIKRPVYLAEDIGNGFCHQNWQLINSVNEFTSGYFRQLDSSNRSTASHLSGWGGMKATPELAITYMSIIIIWSIKQSNMSHQDTLRWLDFSNHSLIKLLPSEKKSTWWSSTSFKASSTLHHSKNHRKILVYWVVIPEVKCDFRV